ncbi:SurA N-terminal domain-containing protein [candidate division WOR-3 bacterium]|nr:SurA N-terminal domain-containing protein [candidate division WOR-3 bacterium]
MLMERVRSVTKYFMWFAVIAFVFSMAIGFGTTMFWKGNKKDENIIAGVNNETITVKEYADALRSRLQSISGALGTDPIRERQISESVINQLITDKIIEDLLRKRRISVSEDQLINIIRENPPPEITQNPDFWMGEQFNYDRYFELLKDPRAGQFIMTYASQIAENLPMSILRGEISSMARVTSGEAIEKFFEDSVKVRIEYIRLPLEEWKSEVASMSEEDFFSNNKEMFRRDYLIKMGYVSFPVSIDEETIRTTKELAISVTERAETDSFDLLQRQYTYFPDDRALLNGWVKVNDLEHDFATALTGMRKGNVSKPIKSDKGFHILKLEDRHRDSVEVKEIFLPVFASFEEFQKSSTEAWNLVKKLRSDSLPEIPEKYNPQYISLGKGALPDISVNFGTFLINPKEGDVSYPLIGEDGFYVFWIEEKEEGIPAFSEIEEEVRDSLVNYEAAARAKNYALGKYSGDKLPRKPEKGEWGRTPYFTLGNHEKYNIPAKVAFLSLNIRRNEVLPPIRVGESVYVVKQIDFKMPDTEKLREYVPAIAMELQRAKETYSFQKWFYQYRKEYNIEDYREKIYE